MTKDEKKILKQVNKLADKHFPKIAVQEVVLNPYLKSTLASMAPGAKLLEVNYSYWEDASPKEFERLLLHELIHLYLFSDGKKWAHGKDFKKLAKQLGLREPDWI